jgi:hypothetical protein
VSRQQIQFPVQQVHVATPSPPPAGSLKLYPKSDNVLYKLTSTGVESAVGVIPDPLVVNNATVNQALTMGTSGRIKGLLSGTPVANRLMFQSSVANAGASLGVMPDGTSRDASLAAFNASNPDNSGYVDLSIGSTQASVSAGKVGTGSFLPLTFATSGVERLRIETDGRIDVPSHRLRLMGKGANPTSGQSLEMGFETPANLGFIYAFDWGASAWRDLDISGRNVLIRVNGGSLTLPNASITNPMIAGVDATKVTGTHNYVHNADWFRNTVSGQGIYNNVDARGVGFNSAGPTNYHTGQNLVDRTAAEQLTNKTMREPYQFIGAAGIFGGNTTDMANYCFGYGTGTFTMPATSGRQGQVRWIKAWGGGITVNSSGANLAPPGGTGMVSSFTINNGDSVTMVCDGNYWWTI